MNMFNCFRGIHYTRFCHKAALCAGVLLLGCSLTVNADTIQDAHKLFKQGQHGQAMEKVNSLLATKPKDAQARFLKGLILTEQGKTAEAVKIFTSLTEDYPELPEPYNNLAVLYASQGQYDKAKLALEMAIRTHPSYATAHENLGDIYAKMASQAYDRALQLDRSNTTTQTKLAMIQELFAGSTRGKASLARTNPGSGKVETASKVEAVTPIKTEVAAPVIEAVSKPVAVRPEPAKAEPVKTDSGKTDSGKTELAAIKPAPAKQALPSNPNEVMKAVNAWAAAWSAKDVKRYLSFYAADFVVPDGTSRATWEATRKERIGKPKTIKVGISGETVSFTDNEHATVKFHQSYHASHLSITGNKTMQLVRIGGEWLIQEESAK